MLFKIIVMDMEFAATSDDAESDGDKNAPALDKSAEHGIMSTGHFTIIYLKLFYSDYGIIKKKSKTQLEVTNVHYIGKIDRNIYKCVTNDIITDEVIITERQIAHIKDRHPNDYDRYFDYAKEIIENPDYILEANKPDTAFLLKHIDDNGKNYQLILRLKTSSDPKNYKNSIITFLKVEEKRYNRYLRTKKILYKSE